MKKGEMNKELSVKETPIRIQKNKVLRKELIKNCKEWIILIIKANTVSVSNYLQLFFFYSLSYMIISIN